MPITIAGLVLLWPSLSSGDHIIALERDLMALALIENYSSVKVDLTVQRPLTDWSTNMAFAYKVDGHF